MQPGSNVFVLSLVAALIAGTQGAMAQRCPPNSHPEAVAIPGNLRTAQCFCDRGFTRVDGICVPVRRPADRPPPNDPGRVLVAPMPFR
jgi:hypothetical protein